MSNQKIRHENIVYTSVEMNYMGIYYHNQYSAEE